MSLIRSITPALLGALLLAGSLSAQGTGTVAGQVVDAATLEPISGASVAVAGTGGITNDAGRFLVTGVASGTHTLRVSRIGYAESTQEVTVTAGQTATVEVRLSSEALGLGELVVTSSYGQQREGELTGVINQVEPEQFNPGRVVSPEQLIQGKVAGVQIYDSGEPGAGVAIRIRGGTSVNASNEPLFGVDGVPLSVGGGISAGRNPLNFMNPDDIASITVLKDASATAIYGSRGANGVILIETFNGRDQAARGNNMTYTGSYSTSTVADEPEMLTPDQFREAVNDYANSRLSLLGTAETDWRDAVQQQAVGHEHNVSVAGALADANYRLSLGYLEQQGVLRGTETERTTLGINYGQNLFDNAVRITANLKGAHAQDHFTPGIIGTATMFDPTQPIYDETSPYGGFFEYADRDLIPFNPVAEVELVEDQGTTLRSVGDIEAHIDIPYVSDLTGTVRLGYDVIRTNRQIFRPTTLFSQARLDTLAGFMSQANNTQLNRLVDAFFNYGRRIEGVGTDVDFTAGYSYEDSHAEFPYFEVVGLESDFLGRFGVPTVQDVRPSNWVSEERLISFFGRAHFTVQDRYLLTLSLRRDGSSKFGPDQQWGWFPAVGAGWRILDEGSSMGDLLSSLKLRASWGVNGNQAIAPYQQFPSYRLGEETAQYQFGDEFVATIRPSAADRGIKWEETTSWNLGVDFGVLANRLSGSVDYYYKRTEDLLFNVPVAAGSNLSNYLTTNIGTLDNQGIELALDARLLEGNGGGFYWDASFNAARNTNELVQVNPYSDPEGGAETILTGGISGGVGNFIQILRPGLPINTFYVYQHIRGADDVPVWQDTNEDGTINEQDLYVDQPTIPCPDDPDQLCGDGLINEDDRIPFNSPNPDWILGFTSFLGYGPVDASFSLRAQLGNYVYNNVASNFGHYRALRYVDVPQNLHASVLETGFESEQYLSDYYVEDASFLRLDNLTLGYTFSPLAGGQRIRLFGTAENLFTLTEYRGVDPLAGVNGIDNNLYPRSRTFVMGATVQF